MIERYTRREMGEVWGLENKFKKMLDIEIAVCEVLSKKGMIPEKSLNNIKKKGNFNIKRIDKIEKVVKHDVIAFLTSVAEIVGEDSKYIHMGLTSSDVVDTGFSLQVKEASAILINDIKNLLKVLKKQAVKYTDTPMMGRTHGIHAEPITFGFKVAVWYSEIKRCFDIFKTASVGMCTGKISGAVGNFANIGMDVERMVCSKIGLKPEPISTQIIQRDRHASYINACALLASSLEKIAVEIRNLARTDIGELEEPFTKGQKGSSAMPHKRNPVSCEQVTGLARLIRSHSLPAMENIALWHERDISHSSVERIIFPDSCIALNYIINKMIYIISDMKVNKDKMLENINLTKGVIFSQRVLLKLIDKGLIREDAYKIVQRVSHKAYNEGIEFRELLKDDKEVVKLLNPKEIDNIFKLDCFLKNINKIVQRALNA